MPTNHVRTGESGREWSYLESGRLRTGLWILAIALLCVGVLITITTLIHVSESEADPVFRYLFMYTPASVALTVAVAAQLSIAYVLYQHVERPVRILIPAGLALYGATVVLWNWTYLASL